MGDEHYDAVRDKVGVYYKYKSHQYRSICEGCGKGYHQHRWQAHHVLPGTCFGGLEKFVRECLGVTKYDINETYSMAGMPTLKAFLMYFRTQTGAAESPAQLSRWKTIRTYIEQAASAGVWPGDYPCHQPVSFGHYIYNGDVSTYLKDNIWDDLMKSKKDDKHMKPKDIYSLLEAAAKHFWGDLVARGSGAGGGGLTGVKQNFMNRKGTAKNGWWKPMCMADVPTAPEPPAFF